MISIAHQWLLLWIARKMTADGFVLVACDGKIPQGGLWNALPRPSEFAGVRPDACGFAPNTGELAFGEAKTFQDIDTLHTRKQLSVFGRFPSQGGTGRCRLYIAVPRSATVTLDQLLGQLGLLGASHIVRLHIPDCFLKDESI
jgi:hypothetical protein